MYLWRTPIQAGSWLPKRGRDGEVLSCLSEPGIVALQLQQLDVRPGHRVLEVGTGTGYTAALLAHLVGPHGRVITIDVDAAIVADARRHLGLSDAAPSRSCSATGLSVIRLALRTTGSSLRWARSVSRTVGWRRWRPAAGW